MTEYTQPVCQKELPDDVLLEMEWKNAEGGYCCISVHVDGTVKRIGDFSWNEAAKKFWEVMAQNSPYKKFVETLESIDANVRVVVFKGEYELNHIRGLAEQIALHNPEFLVVCLPEGVDVATFDDKELERIGLQRIPAINS